MTPAIHSSGFLVALGYTSGLRLGVIPAQHVTRNLVTSTKCLVGGSRCRVGSSACLGQSVPGGRREGGQAQGGSSGLTSCRVPAVTALLVGASSPSGREQQTRLCPPPLSPCGEILFLSYVPTRSQPALAFLPLTALPARRLWAPHPAL